MAETIRKDHPFAGPGAIILCAVFWSFNGILIKFVQWHPMLIAGGRSILAAIFLCVTRIIFRQNVRKWESLSILLLGSVNYAVTMILFVIANKLTSSANAILLQYTAPVWAALLGWLFLKEKPRGEHWAALVMVGGGMFLFFKNSLGGGSLTGDILALISGVTFGAHTVILRKAKEQNPADILIGANVLTGIISLPFFFLYPPEWSLPNIAGISLLGFVQIGAASALFAYGIQRVTVIQAVLFMMIEPVLNPVWVLLVYREMPSMAVITGGCIILAAIVFSSVVTWIRARNGQKINMASP
jgi:drug/metabolite transporter (DMT)-like permease